jgi:hypothetical protein
MVAKEKCSAAATGGKCFITTPIFETTDYADFSREGDARKCEIFYATARTFTSLSRRLANRSCSCSKS